MGRGGTGPIPWSGGAVVLNPLAPGNSLPPVSGMGLYRHMMGKVGLGMKLAGEPLNETMNGGSLWEDILGGVKNVAQTAAPFIPFML
jgi:hypothetical protein